MFMDLLKRRRSIRKYTPEPVQPELIQTLVKAALLSPSSRSINPWEFVIVRDPKVLQQLSESKQGAGFLAGAALAIVVIADTRKSDVWVEDCSIAASNILLAAADLGLGACWAQIRKRMHAEGRSAEDYVRSLLTIPEYMGVEAIIGAGYPAEQRPPLSENGLQTNKVHYDRY